MSKYSEASVDIANVNIENMTPTMFLGIHKQTIQKALIIADRLERGDVGFSSLAECSKKYNVKMDDANEFFKAMTRQLLKEEENK